jgi:hypothetical protein
LGPNADSSGFLGIHLANTFLEWELTHENILSLEAAISSHPVFLQLQFLPFLYADKEDFVAVTHLPDEGFFDALKRRGIIPPHLLLLSDCKRLLTDWGSCVKRIESWGASRIVRTWADKQHLFYEEPPWDIVAKVNSKAFSFQMGSKLPGAALLHTMQELVQWEKEVAGPKVLKTCFGFSGRGHLHLPSPLCQQFVAPEWSANRPVIGEPWVTRILDFSTQWIIPKKGQIYYVGSTLCQNDAKGRYHSNTVGEEKVLFGQHLHFLHEQKKSSLPILQMMQDLGYFGHVGIDAMLYNAEEIRLHPIVEINARKTMGWVALTMQKRYFPHQFLTMRYVNARNAKTTENFLLPHSLISQGKMAISFARRKNLEVEIKDIYK